MIKIVLLFCFTLCVQIQGMEFTDTELFNFHIDDFDDFFEPKDPSTADNHSHNVNSIPSTHASICNDSGPAQDDRTTVEPSSEKLNTKRSLSPSPDNGPILKKKKNSSQKKSTKAQFTYSCPTSTCNHTIRAISKSNLISQLLRHSNTKKHNIHYSSIVLTYINNNNRQTENTISIVCPIKGCDKIFTHKKKQYSTLNQCSTLKSDLIRHMCCAAHLTTTHRKKLKKIIDKSSGEEQQQAIAKYLKKNKINVKKNITKYKQTLQKAIKEYYEDN